MKFFVVLLFALSGQLALAESAFDKEVKRLEMRVDRMALPTIKAERFQAWKSEKQILKELLNKEGKGATVYHSYYVKNNPVSQLYYRFFTENAWYPNFCYDLIGRENIQMCQEELNSLIKDLVKRCSGRKVSFSYINGDKQGADFKIIHVLFYNTASEEKLVLHLTIHDERS
jgi:hypothetical protein